MIKYKILIVGLTACCLTSCNTAKRIEQIRNSERLSLHYDYVPDQWGFRYLPVVVQDSVRGGRMIISRDWYSGHHILQIDGDRRGLDFDAHLTSERNGKARIDYRIRVPRPLVRKWWPLSIVPIAETDGQAQILDTLRVTGKDFQRSPFKIVQKDHEHGLVSSQVSRGELSMTYSCSHLVNLPSFRKVLKVYLSAEVRNRVGDTYTLPVKDTLIFRIGSLADYCDTRNRYLTREVDSVYEKTIASRLSFRQGSSTLDKTDVSNRKNLQILTEQADSLLEDPEQILQQIMITAACSPEGSRTLNDRLGEARGRTVRKLLLLRKLLPKQTIQVSSVSENWDKLYKAILAMDPEDGDKKVTLLQSVSDWDERETVLMQNYPELYRRLYTEVYPELREVQFKCRFRSATGKQHIVTDEIDQNYMQALQWMQDWQYDKAMEVLLPYKDINTAICHLCLHQNEKAAQLLEQLDQDANTLYLLAIAYQRMEKHQQAASVLQRSFALDNSMKLRIAHDPEIRELITTFDKRRD